MVSQFCPRCGTQVRLDGAPEPNVPAGPTGLTAITEPIGPLPHRPDGPLAAVPQMFPTELVAPSAGVSQAWSQVPDATGGPVTGLFPGWTGMHPAVAAPGGVGALAPRPERRRRALYAVLGIAALTALVLVVAIFVTPNWGDRGSVAGKDAQPIPAASSAAVVSPDSSTESSESGTHPSTAGSMPERVTEPVRTVTVTAAPTGATAVRPTATAPVPPVTTPPTKKGTTKATTKATPTKPKAKVTKTVIPTPIKPQAQPLGVPQRNISCSAGYIVQLASELDSKAFVARVAALRASGQVPAGALAADSTRSCKIFTSQSNTVVLYAGPFASRYDGCAARLAGPADAFLKGADPARAQEYVSCLCPARTAGLPQYSALGQQGVWVGELQRVLGNRLNISIADLAGNWGTFTPGTKAAVQRFQQEKKLPATGGVDSRTWKALQAANC